MQLQVICIYSLHHVDCHKKPYQNMYTGTCTLIVNRDKCRNLRVFRLASELWQLSLLVDRLQPVVETEIATDSRRYVSQRPPTVASFDFKGAPAFAK